MSALKSVLAIALLVAGAGIYLLFRPRVLIGFVVADRLGLGPMVDQWREAVSNCRLPEFVVYCLPNGLWAAAWVLVCDALFATFSRQSRLLWAAIIPAVGVASELLQGTHMLRGTFDWADLLCYAAPYALYVLYAGKPEK